jgi:hypothetical protein
LGATGLLALAAVVASADNPASGSTAGDGPAKPDKETHFTFCKDVAPIVYEKCTPCHRPGQVAPFSLISYDDVKKRAPLIAQVVKGRSMPPWSAGPCDYTFREDQSLSPRQLSTLTSWLASGTALGSKSDLPPAPHFASTWRLGPPDLIVKMPKAFTVPADGPDIYRNFVVPLHLDSDKYVAAIDFEPGTRTVVHHSLFYWDSSGTARSNDGKDGRPGYDGRMGNILGDGRVDHEANTVNPSKGTFGYLGGWAVGAQAMSLPGDLAFFVKKDADLILGTHFHPSGKVETETSTIGIYFAKKPPTAKFTSLLLPPVFGYFSHIDIPAGKKDYLLTDSYTLPVDVKAYGVSAHAHFLGKSFTLTANLPSGETKTLLNIPSWDFNWQNQYQYNQFVPLPKGTKLVSTMTYDNSTDNVFNPSNPPKEVWWGEQTVNEMGSLILSVVPQNDDDLKLLQTDYRKHIIKIAMSAKPNPRQ